MGLFQKRDKVIDLTTPAPRRPFGLPTRCPVCMGPGYLDRLDIVNRVMEQHCVSCGHRWETGEAELSGADGTSST